MTDLLTMQGMLFMACHKQMGPDRVKVGAKHAKTLMLTEPFIICASASSWGLLETKQKEHTSW